jgi:hypothetical protein
MKPHIIPKTTLKQFVTGEYKKDPSVLVLDKETMIYRDRGVEHSTFLASSNYYGSGEKGTLEYELATNDERSLNEIIKIIRNGTNIENIKYDLHFLLWNNAARNPAFRKHPKVENLPDDTPEEFHRAAMDSFPDFILSDHDPVPIHIDKKYNTFLLPDFSLNYMVLAPDVVILRTVKNNAEEFAKLAADDQESFVDNLNKQSFKIADSWLVAESDEVFKKYGAKQHKKT